MSGGPVAARFLRQEARALLTRLDRVRPFALSETMVPAAALPPRAQAGVERTLLTGRAQLRRQVQDYLAWLDGPGARTAPAEQQRRFTLIRLRFNDVLSQLDLFTEVITQRSDRETGVWLSGLDVLAADALELAGGILDPPPVVCYLARGPGAAIRRARTRLPGDVANPVGIIRVPRERMIGHGIASSLIHEVGHQAAALLDLVPGLRQELRTRAASCPPPQRETWTAWADWISEIVADLWSVARLGISSTLGLMGVVSLPRRFVFRFGGSDPHPVPWIRVHLSCAIGDALYPHPQWRGLASLWRALYPTDRLPAEQRATLHALVASVPEFVRTLLRHTPGSLGGRCLGSALTMPDRRPERLLGLFEQWCRQPSLTARASPTLAFAVTGQARAADRLAPESEARILANLLNHWAVRNALDPAQWSPPAAAHRPVRVHAA